jgi:hypothetical protein
MIRLTIEKIRNRKQRSPILTVVLDGREHYVEKL